MGKFFKRSCCG